MEFDFVRALGVQVVAVPDLNTDAKYLPDDRILLYNADLDPAGKERLRDRILERVSLCVKTPPRPRQ